MLFDQQFLYNCQINVRVNVNLLSQRTDETLNVIANIVGIFKRLVIMTSRYLLKWIAWNYNLGWSQNVDKKFSIHK